MNQLSNRAIDPNFQGSQWPAEKGNSYTLNRSLVLSFCLILFIPISSIPETTSKPLSLAEFDSISRITIGITPNPWLNVLGNGLFGGNYLYLLSNRRDGREFCIDVKKNAAIRTNLKLKFPGTDPQQTIHGIGYSTLFYGGQSSITYFLEPDNRNSEIWFIQNPNSTEILLQYGDEQSKFTDKTLAFQLLNSRLSEITFAEATKRLRNTQKRWQQYITRSLQQMKISDVSTSGLMRELIWDIYQVSATVHTDRFNDPGGEIRLRIPNMGATYTFNAADVHGRDSLQMVPAFSAFDPKVARECILNFTRYQDRTGRIIHRRLFSGEPMDRGHSDESYWLILAAVEYTAHTNDLSLLTEKSPYLENNLTSEYVLWNNPEWVKKFDARQLEPARFTSTQTTILEHLRRAIMNIPLGSHGLPLMEDGDWNDALNSMRKAGESTMNAALYAYSLLKLKEFYQLLGEAKVNANLSSNSYATDLQHFDEMYSAMKLVMNQHAWDGEWYIRGFDDYGKPFGSHANDEGRIYLEPQAWAILAGIPDAERTQKIISSVSRYLIRDDKVSLLAPAYSRKEAGIGAITLLPKGSNENGGQWRQCTLWWIAALRHLGKEQDAIKLLNSIILANSDPIAMGTEPYLYNEYVRGPEAIRPGSGGQQAHVQQAALVLHMLGHCYQRVSVTKPFIQKFDYPGLPVAATLKTITGQGEQVDWRSKWIDDPPKYEIVRLSEN